MGTRQRVCAAAAWVLILGATSMWSVSGAAATTSASTRAQGSAAVIRNGDLDTFTLTGTIPVGSAAFDGTATGSVQAFYPQVIGMTTSNTIISPFALSGPNLTGTCSGLWVISRRFSPDVVVGTVVDSAMPAAYASLSCTLQLNDSAPAQSSLSLLLLEGAPFDGSQYSGGFGPGTSGTVGSRYYGTATAYFVDIGGEEDEYDLRLVGDIPFGTTVFHGVAGGTRISSEDVGPPLELSGSSPSGDLTATCTHDVLTVDTPVQSEPVAGVGVTDLTCRGHVGSGADATTSIMLVLPLDTSEYGFCGPCSQSDDSGVYMTTAGT